MNKYLKIVISVLFVSIGVYFIAEREYGWGVLLFLLAIFPLILFFRNENILLAFWQLRKQNIEGAKKWLNKIKNPETELAKMQFGYYYYMKGLVNGQENISESETYMKKALQYGLTFDHDKAMAKLTLASTAMAKGRKKEAEILLDEAKKLDKTEMLKDQIKMMKDQMKKMNIGNNLQNPNMRRGGMKGKFF
jgi:tetratricopeptide (TPR) repeat protein